MSNIEKKFVWKFWEIKMDCENKGKYEYCKGKIDGRIKYINGLKVCTCCYNHLKTENKK